MCCEADIWPPPWGPHFSHQDHRELRPPRAFSGRKGGEKTEKASGRVPHVQPPRCPDCPSSLAVRCQGGATHPDPLVRQWDFRRWKTQGEEHRRQERNADPQPGAPEGTPSKDGPDPRVPRPARRPSRWRRLWRRLTRSAASLLEQVPSSHTLGPSEPGRATGSLTAFETWVYVENSAPLRPTASHFVVLWKNHSQNFAFSTMDSKEESLNILFLGLSFWDLNLEQMCPDRSKDLPGSGFGGAHEPPGRSGRPPCPRPAGCGGRPRVRPGGAGRGAVFSVAVVSQQGD